MPRLTAIGERVFLLSDDGAEHELDAATLLRLARTDGVERDRTLDGVTFAGRPARTRFALADGVACAQVLVAREWHVLKSLDRDHVLMDRTWLPLELTSFSLVRQFVADFGTRSLVEQSVAAALSDARVIDLPTPDEVPFDAPVPYPAELKAELRTYQAEAHQWMTRMARAGLGGILGDEMGLGKTIACIAVLCSLQETRLNARFLVVMPLSLVDNWRREIHRFAPDLRIYVHHGPERALVPRVLLEADFDVMLTTYDVVSRDAPVLSQVSFTATFCDEAQNVKNSATARWAAVSALDSGPVFLVTGTPLENSIADVCSLATLAVPRVARSADELVERFTGDAVGLSRWIRPLLLRRRLDDVGLELPPRIDQTLWLSPGHAEHEAYVAVQEELAARRASPLEVVNRLRMASGHPGLVLDEVPLTGSTVFQTSSRCSELLSRLTELANTGEKSLVFASWQQLLDALSDGIERAIGGWVGVIDGRTRPEDRQPMIDAFTDATTSAVLLLNPKAAGVGLNIQAASRVHHLTLEWNPAIEAQASARAHRSGQTRPVHVIRYVYPGTVDAIIEERLDEKRELAGTVVESNAGAAPTSTDVTRLLTIRP